MKFFNAYYLLVIAAGVVLWNINLNYNTETMLFYGFAENKETEINLNHPVIVNEILIKPGDFVKEGTVLAKVSHIKLEKDMQDQNFRISELRAKEDLWLAASKGEIDMLKTKKRIELEELDRELQEVKKELDFKKSLYDGLQSIEQSNVEASYQPLTEKIENLNQERRSIVTTYDKQITNIETEISLGKNPYNAQVNRMNAEKAYLDANKIKAFDIVAPTDGVIGNVHCKEAEHIPSYKTLITFYEPNPTQVKGYVHEGLILKVAVRDSFKVNSTKNDTMFCYGVVTGLGSRIVEIPERLRKIPEMKTYGREVLIDIPSNNDFLQKEKVVLHFRSKDKSVVSTSPKSTGKIAKKPPRN